MSFFEHLEELRGRLLRAVLAVIVGFSVCWFFRQELYTFLVDPLLRVLPEGDKSVKIISPAEAFFTYLKIAFAGGVLIAVPFILYQMWKFIAPGLYPRERKLAFPFVLIATALFYIGSAFAYLLVFPVIFKFFMGFTSPELQPMISFREYVSLVTKLILAFGMIFETPIIIVFLGLLGVVDTNLLKKGRRYFIVLAFVIGALLSPPDVVSQILMGLPLLILYEASIHVLAVIERRRRIREEEERRELDLPEEMP